MVLPSAETPHLGLGWLKTSCFRERNSLKTTSLQPSQPPAEARAWGWRPEIGSGDGCGRDRPLPRRRSPLCWETRRQHGAFELPIAIRPLPGGVRTLPGSWLAAHRLPEPAGHRLGPPARAGAALELGQHRQEISDIFPAANRNESLEQSTLGSARSSLPRVS